MDFTRAENVFSSTQRTVPYVFLGNGSWQGCRAKINDILCVDLYYNLSVDISFILGGDSITYMIKMKYLSTDWNKIVLIQKSKNIVYDFLCREV